MYGSAALVSVPRLELCHPCRCAELILTKSLLFALYAVLRIPAPAVKGIRLRSQPNAPRAASAA